MSAINFVVRTGAGNVQRGIIEDGAEQTIIQGGRGYDVSLNLAQNDLRGYFRDGDQLVITLADGRVVTIDDYFADTGVPTTRLYLSTDGLLSEVLFETGSDGVLFASYGPSEVWGKWSADDALIFADRAEVLAAGPGGETVSMLAPGLLGIGGLGTAAGGIAAAGLAVSALGGGDSESGGSDELAAPTIDNDDPVTIGGDGSEPDQTIDVTGTGEPGSTVVVTVGDKTIETIVGDDGTWTVTFDGDDFPADGVYTITAVVTDPNGTETALTGGTVTIDTTGPDVAVTGGASSVGFVVNDADHSDGIDISGTGEVGASIAVTANGVTHSTVVGADGTWTVQFASSELPTGELDVPVVIVATDSFGNTTTLNDSFAIDTIGTVSIDTDTTEGDGTVNGTEHADGVVINGTAEPGSTVEVTVGSVVQPATVDANGAWTVTFAPGDFPTGETTVTVTATATDGAGNSSSASGTINVDTLVNTFDITHANGGADGIVNAEEGLQGLAFSGSVEPGSSVSVEFNGVTLPATVSASGAWTVSFPASAVPATSGSFAVNATATDAAGNTATATSSVMVDPSVENLTLDGPIAGNDVVNGTESGGVITLTGTVEGGSSVMVSFAGMTVAATVAADGTWSADFSGAGLANQEFDTTAMVTATDAAGNTASVSRPVQIDTYVNELSMMAASSIAGDGMVNVSEALGGVTLTGTVEAGSSVVVNFDGTDYTATVDASGAWSVVVPSSAFAMNADYSADITVTATDAAGNVSQISDSVHVDTEAPFATKVATYTEDFQGNVIGVSVDAANDIQEVYVETAAGAINEVPHTQVDIPAIGQTSMFFDQSVPDGSHLVLIARDQAGNLTGTYQALDEAGTDVVDLSNPALLDYNIEAIDLQFADEAELTITDAEITAMSENSDILTVYGGMDDQVTITGATLTGQQTEFGTTFNVYDMGDSTIRVEDEITNVSI
ncbi:Ig-like domain-containing protein [Pseudaestuariivita sp.]|uniref:Ig-like domain-containing protein n=1 Tax=Pseudaestuariivita sp. TaxID=2211669 RepID=UPI0040590437